MHQPTDRIAHTTAFLYTSRGALAGTRNMMMMMILLLLMMMMMMMMMNKISYKDFRLTVCVLQLLRPVCRMSLEQERNLETCGTFRNGLNENNTHIEYHAHDGLYFSADRPNCAKFPSLKCAHISVLA